MIGTLYNQYGQLNIKVLLVCPYDLDHHGGVQNQVKLLKNGLVNKGINTKILGPSSYDFDIGNAVKIPFNGSQNPITFFPSKKIIKEAISWADVIHVHEPFMPFFFWRLHTKKKIIVTHHANIGKFIKACLKFLYLFTRNKKLYSTAVSNEALNNATALNKEIVIMHPGPMNRGVEIDGIIADDLNRSVIQEQVEIGVALRMAILHLLVDRQK